MPTAAEYRHAAHKCRTLAEGYQRQSAAVLGWRLEQHIVAPALTTALSDHLARAGQRLQRAAEAVLAAAAVCERRAHVCEDYARRLARWDARPVWERLLVDRPQPPYPWVSA
jgi:hypothetical protein